MAATVSRNGQPGGRSQSTSESRPPSVRDSQNYTPHSQPAHQISYRSRWWQIRWFRGMYRDLLRRSPWYLSDWTDAWDYRVVPATIYVYFTNILPALAFSLDMFAKTDMSYGVNEVLFSSVIASTFFAFFSAQPLVIVGVTGPITVFNYTVYDIIHTRAINYFEFMCWIGLWGLVFHVILAISNSCVALRYVTKLPCDTFGFFVAIVYIEKGVEVLIRQFPSPESSATASDASAFLSIVLALLTFLIADTAASSIYRGSLFRAPIRKFFEDYSLPLAVVFLSGMIHVGKMKGVQLDYLPTGGKAFEPTAKSEGRDRTGWVIPFWQLPAADIFLALPFGFLLTVLFWFDHNVSSLIAQSTSFPLRKPAGFHWDIFLLGITTGLTGLLGIPFPNGLIPQAPFHTMSLCVYPSSTRRDRSAEHSQDEANPEQDPGAISKLEPGIEKADDDERTRSGCPSSSLVDMNKPTHVVEQRVSNLAQGLITLFTMSGPALTALRQIPQGVLAGLFFVMGFQALWGNEIVKNIASLFRDPALTPSSTSTSRKRRKPLIILLTIEIVVVAVTFALTHTVAAIGFPLLFALLIPARHIPWLIPALIRDREALDELDGPIASAETMEGVCVAQDEKSGGRNGAMGLARSQTMSPSRDDVRDVEEGLDRHPAPEYAAR